MTARVVEVAELNTETVRTFLAWSGDLKDFEARIGQDGFVKDIYNLSRALNGLDPDSFKDAGPVTAKWTAKGQLYMIDGSEYRP
jgi:hypothetical protein